MGLDMKIIQVKLKSGRSRMTTWVEKRSDVKVGNKLELKEIPDKVWEIDSVYSIELNSRDLDFHRKWDNNNYDKHVGLGLHKK